LDLFLWLILTNTKLKKNEKISVNESRIQAEKILYDADFVTISKKTSLTIFGNSKISEVCARLNFSPNQVPGFYLANNFLTISEHNFLIREIYSRPWTRDLENKNIQIYGYNYVNPKLPEIPIPQFLFSLIQRLSDLAKFDHVIITEYLPNTGIGPHVDRFYWGEVIVGISLESSCTITLASTNLQLLRKRNNSVDVFLPERSMYILSGEARYKYTHAINPIHIRSKRVSITLRSMATSKVEFLPEDVAILHMSEKND